MKRIYLLMLLLVAFTANVFAQRNVDLRPLHAIGKTQSTKHYIATGEKLLADAAGSSKYWVSWSIINTGPDTLMAGDTLKIRAAYGTTYRYYFKANTGLGAPDTITIIPVDGSGNETSVTLTPGGAITKSETKTTSWCDSIWAIKGPSNSAINDPQGNNKLCTDVEMTWWLTGVNTVTNEEDGFILFPNPATNNLTIRFDFGAGAQASVVIRDITGKAVYTQELGKNISGLRDFNVDISSLRSGLYTAELSYNDQKIVSKLNIR